MYYIFFLFKQKTAYEMRISDWSSDVCSSDLSMAGDPFSQALMKPGSQAMLIAKTDHQPLRRTAQKYLEGRQVLNHWQAQVAAGEFDFRALGAKAQVGADRKIVV